jgi:hypothetical protein
LCHREITQGGPALFTDEKRGRVGDERRRQDTKLFAPMLTPDLLLQAARLCGLRLVSAPLNLINRVWLAVRAARHPQESFAALLGLPLKGQGDGPLQEIKYRSPSPRCSACR